MRHSWNNYDCGTCWKRAVGTWLNLGLDEYPRSEEELRKKKETKINFLLSVKILYCILGLK
jgi:hypothetical protein